MFSTILLAVDLNDPEGAARPAKAAQHLAQFEGAALHVLSVLPDLNSAMVGAYLGKDHAKRAAEEARSLLETWTATTLPEVTHDHLHLGQGTIYDTVLKTADRIGADAIVVGSHRPVLKDYLMGPNAARIVRHATQSVFVIR